MKGQHLGRALLVLMLVAGLAAAGCGGDDDDGDEGSSITKEEWIAEANQICREGDQEMERAGQKAFAEAEESGRPDPQAEARFLEAVVAPGIEQQVTDIAALPRPDGDEEEIETIVAAAEEGVEKVNADPAALEAEPDPFGEASRLMAAYGVTDCG